MIFNRSAEPLRTAAAVRSAPPRRTVGRLASPAHPKSRGRVESLALIDPHLVAGDCPCPPSRRFGGWFNLR